jgi:hypothetical protein
MLAKVKAALSLLSEIKALPKIEIDLDCKSEACRNVYRSFTERHPKYKVVRKKELGVALLDLAGFNTADDYFRSLNAKDGVAKYSRRAAKEGYVFSEVDRNKYVEDIFTINTSKDERQGRPMLDHYKKKIASYPVDPEYKYYGVMKDDKLVAYMWVALYGEVAIIDGLLGHEDHLKNRIMYLLCTGAASHLITDHKSTRYFMYDTYFGAQEGLKQFKRKLGFVPYRVKWKCGSC